MNQGTVPTRTTLNYGDLVIYNQNGKTCNALVFQSQTVPVPDRGAPAGVRNEEHLTLTYLEPERAKPLMSQIEMEAATRKIFGVREYGNGNPTGWIRAKVIVENGEEQPEYAGAQSGHGERDGS
jgi:hypothetical protein